MCWLMLPCGAVVEIDFRKNVKTYSDNHFIGYKQVLAGSLVVGVYVT